MRVFMFENIKEVNLIWISLQHACDFKIFVYVLTEALAHEKVKEELWKNKQYFGFS